MDPFRAVATTLTTPDLRRAAFQALWLMVLAYTPLFACLITDLNSGLALIASALVAALVHIAVLHLQVRVAAARAGTDGSLGAGDFFALTFGSLIPGIAAGLALGFVGGLLVAGFSALIEMDGRNAGVVGMFLVAPVWLLQYAVVLEFQATAIYGIATRQAWFMDALNASPRALLPSSRTLAWVMFIVFGWWFANQFLGLGFTDMYWRERYLQPHSMLSGLLVMALTAVAWPVYVVDTTPKAAPTAG